MPNILTDSVHKIAYATDASVYREIPYGVAYPSCANDIIQLIAEARQRNTNIIARAAGTSIAGQVVGNGIVADISRHMNHILEINAEQRYAWVEPGVVRDELNIACKPYGLFFSPETSTSNRCCIGGMMGNNSCGTHSLVYGSTRHHVMEAYGVLADGTIEHFRPYTISELEQRFSPSFWTINPDLQSLIERIYSQLIRFALNLDTRQLILDNYPDSSLTRRSCGYAIDEVIAELCDDDLPLGKRRINLCQLLSGSEGTLAFITKIKVSLDPLPPSNIMVLCAHCVSLDAAFQANLIALQHTPTAVELMDGEILRLSEQSRDTERFFVEGSPAALLMIELRDDSLDVMNARAAILEQALVQSRLVQVCTRVYGNDVNKVWNLRKAGLGILSSMKGDAKPTGVIEDTAVAPARLPAYMADFRTMLKKLNTSCVFYGHISTGELHLRPILNLKTADGRKLFREIACQTTQLVRRHRGTISGEHGDGRLRGEFIPMLYGEPTYELMRQVKYCWDEDNIFNPHKIVDTPPMDSDMRYDINQSYAISHKLKTTYYNWKASFDECKTEGATGAATQTEALMCTIEQCNGAADCRKSNLIGGTMCPAFKVSADETMTTRARANILREILTRGVDRKALFSSPEIIEVLTSCLACKGCYRECPSGVDMTRLRSEVLQHIYDEQGMPLRTWLVSRMATIEKLGSLVPHIYNFFATNKLTAKIIKNIVGFAQERTIPALSSSRLSTSNNNNIATDSKSAIYFFADEFTTLQEAELGQCFINLVQRLGYNVIIPRHTESGRAPLSKGNLKYAKRLAKRNVTLLKDIITPETPLVGIEPSCILTFRDEYPDLVPPEMRQQAQQLGHNSLLYDEFLMREVQAGRISADMFSDREVEIWLHGHCHQKALVGVEKTAALLDLPHGTKVHVIPSGCCGMAGSFGYEKEHYKTSIAIGEMILFPTIRQHVKPESANSDIQMSILNSESTPLTLVAAPGTSCRQQIFDGTGIKAHHPIEILYALLK